jgi:hypothetical protein
MLSRVASVLIGFALAVAPLFSTFAYAQSAPVGPAYPPGSPSGWVCLALTPYTNAVLAYSATVDPAPACQALQGAINQQLQHDTGGWGMAYAIELENSVRQHYADDPGCLPGCTNGSVPTGARLACDITVAAIEYVVISANSQDPVCTFLQSLPKLQPQADLGVTIISDSTGQQTYLQPGAFVKVGDGPAIYVVHYGQLHAFGTWQQYLNAGGATDLSNVVRYTALRDNGGLLGAPAQ